MSMLKRAFAAAMLAMAITAAPATAFDGTGFIVKPSTVAKGTAALAAGKFCWKHKFTCGAVVVGGAVGVTALDGYLDDKKAELRALLEGELRQRFGDGFDVCELFESCRELLDGDMDYREALTRVAVFLGGLGAAEENFDDDRGCHKNLYIVGSIAPEAARHVLDAQAAGWPRQFTYGDPAGKSARRNAAMRAFEHQARAAGMPTSGTGLERDEYPPASMAEAGANSSVRLIDEHDNQMGGRMIRTQTSRLPVGCRVTIIAIPGGGL
jgi:hypothetical protein